jgi:hypothetical protein
LLSLAKILFMKFKFIALSVFFTCIAYFSYSQTSDAEADAIINLLGVQKKQAIAELVPVTGKDSVAFWKLYDEYQQENKKTAKARLSLYERTAHAYANMTPTIADSLSMQYFANRYDQEKSLETYYKKIKDATNAVVAFEFYQAEAYMLTQVRAHIMQQVPTYGHLVHTLKK